MATHHFQPLRYHVTLGWHEPALQVADGDTVVTTTVDAGGCDATGGQVTERGNPQTGPFYVEGAEPGDALVVHLDHLSPNRPEGYSAAAVAPNVVDPGYVRTLPSGERCRWRIDSEHGTAALVSPVTRLGELTLPLEPMLGCFGVAPASGQAISTATSGPHGGNMDYRG